MAHEARSDESVGLADAIAEVRRELAQAEREEERSDWRFRVDRVSLEFAVELHRTGEGRLSLRLGVVEAGAGDPRPGWVRTGCSSIWCRTARPGTGRSAAEGASPLRRRWCGVVQWCGVVRCSAVAYGMGSVRHRLCRPARNDAAPGLPGPAG
ncbi:hypothetical protein OG946_11020 [Streptomyces sp. NBC_01808]|uniref:trypco2 family protein n=1 Tax=Streptomyces sp. NBC_01808 TaxID=2975947 RepID=UPI002DDB4DFE|nr:trypco2 family protein [Streptomyces sp. NBC_01808]WSA37870.1 hypothetical protein OG946_11020 [Streptomyces sp. NBC_01808]